MTYAQFWRRYLAAHASPHTRALHFCGSTLALLFVMLALITHSVWWLAAALLAGYGCAWTAHYAVEHNRPETFGHPLWSLFSDYRMLALWLTGRLHRHLEQAGP